VDPRPTLLLGFGGFQELMGEAVHRQVVVAVLDRDIVAYGADITNGDGRPRLLDSKNWPIK
jgi:hypothetical protein